ncbi:MAG: 8-oxo-dGTP diphosphatase [Methylacidiphilales bacterium]|nr:8-oxo-dGTP diphosphatase [Candidatus Methylacidiphilales bacterium]MDW8349179.1 8-oxo-dGTP diphosphatase [Verrucomicrobiae bacterium]
MQRMPAYDWSRWEPRDRATLLFVLDNERRRVLLIEKKRGLGAGKVNGPGGRVETGETPEDAAVRETQEEIGIRPLDPVLMGELSFQFRDGYGLFCSVFAACRYEGELVETAEAKPFWVEQEAIPYERMWKDDALWLPLLLRGQRFRGCFYFDGDEMLEHRIEIVEQF